MHLELLEAAASSVTSKLAYRPQERRYGQRQGVEWRADAGKNTNVVAAGYTDDSRFRSRALQRIGHKLRLVTRAGIIVFGVRQQKRRCAGAYMRDRRGVAKHIRLAPKRRSQVLGPDRLIFCQIIDATDGNHASDLVAGEAGVCQIRWMKRNQRNQVPARGVPSETDSVCADSVIISSTLQESQSCRYIGRVCRM